MFTIHIYTLDITFQNVNNAYVRLMDFASGKEFCRYSLTGSSNKNAMIMCRLMRGGSSGWTLHAIGESTTGRTANDIKDYVAESFGTIEVPNLELTIFEGKDLVAMDSNGKSGTNLFQLTLFRPLCQDN